MVTPPGGSSDRRDGGSTGEEEEEEEEVPMGDKEMDTIGMERKQMIMDVLVLPLLPKQKKMRKNGKSKKQ